jgi:hypothetical protein
MIRGKRFSEQVLKFIFEILFDVRFEKIKYQWSHERDGATPKMNISFFSELHPVLHVGRWSIEQNISRVSKIVGTQNRQISDLSRGFSNDDFSGWSQD